MALGCFPYLLILSCIALVPREKMDRDVARENLRSQLWTVPFCLRLAPSNERDPSPHNKAETEEYRAQIKAKQDRRFKAWMEASTEGRTMTCEEYLRP